MHLHFHILKKLYTTKKIIYTHRNLKTKRPPSPKLNQRTSNNPKKQHPTAETIIETPQSNFITILSGDPSRPILERECRAMMKIDDDLAPPEGRPHSGALSPLWPRPGPANPGFDKGKLSDAHTNAVPLSGVKTRR